MKDKMNVLFMITDQLRADMLHCYGNNIVKTPNLDKFAKRGVKFTNAFCTNPMCMPNRATLLTGYYPNVHQVRSNGINLPTNIPTITQALIKEGYHTINVGKTHFNFWTPPYKLKPKSAESFDDWRVKKPKGKHLTHENFPMPYYGFQEVDLVVGHGCLCLGHYLDWVEERDHKIAEEIRNRFTKIDNFFTLFCDPFIPEELYNTTYVKEHTTSFLERYSNGEYGDKPFFLHCSFPDPHHPVSPPGKYYDMYDPEKIELPKNIDDIKNLYEHPFLGPHMREPAFRGALLRESTEEEIRKFIALNYGSITMLDDAIGEIMKSLEKFGLDSNTMVIFTSDHGDYMADHGMLLKGPSPFIGTLQVPLIWKVPGISKSEGIANSIVNSVDIPRTTMDLLNVKERRRPPLMQGYDLTPILQEPTGKVRDYCLITEDEEIGPKGPIYTRVHHLITEDYKLTVYGEINNYGDLFDRKNDPLELNNLWGKNKELQLDLLDKLLHEAMQVKSRFPARQGAT
ncbi:MAG: sulfatase family protein [Promethearchaeota archaeon]